MIEFMTWLRVELLRLRSFDWGSGSRRTQWLKDGVAKFSSFYRTRDLATKLGISDEELLNVIDSTSVVAELEGKSFTLGWNEVSLTLSWLEEGISEWKTMIDQNYSEDDGKYYSTFRLKQVVVYLDGTERVVSDTGEPRRAPISEAEFREALEQIRRSSQQ